MGWLQSVGSLVLLLWSAAGSGVEAPPLAAHRDFSRVLTTRLGRTVTPSLCLSELPLVLQIIFSRREVRVWEASWDSS